MTSFPVLRTCPYGPPEPYRELRERGPVQAEHPRVGKIWLITRHAEMRQVLIDPRFSADPRNPGHPNADEEFVPGGFIGMDPPEHSRFRKLLIPEFSVPRLKKMRPGIQQVVDGLIEDMLAAGDSADLVTAFALPVPSLVICQLLGVPYSDHEFFQSRTSKMVDFDTKPEESRALGEELGHYLGELVAQRGREPQDDLISRMLASGKVSPEEIIGSSVLLLIAGHETTANMISLGVLTLLDNPGWAQDPRAVDELLRYHSIADLVTDRVAVADVEIGGKLIRAGEAVVTLGLAANWDETVFERPEQFDPTRVRNHLAFGYGVHQCIGQNLARAELEIAYRTLFERVPTLRLAAPVAELPFKYNSAIFGLHSMPVTW
ncbi:cytochrome P450 monooxygenase [Kutzneria viridogrisea]|uniref:Cytochrome P450 monooxygenase n=1 Tax=Kutzneria viridogrisea TaxID=47990 RepID=A0ABR6BBI9_9PSEU|nr:cytochrome P450 monooxygenase [Kutzneria viridogrisea]